MTPKGYNTFKFSALVEVPTILLLPDYKLKRGEIITLCIKLPILLPTIFKNNQNILVALKLAVLALKDDSSLPSHRLLGDEFIL